jgi:hypothetical protein
MQNDNTKRFLVKPINGTNPNLAKSKWFEQGGFVFLSISVILKFSEVFPKN